MNLWTREKRLQKLSGRHIIRMTLPFPSLAKRRSSWKRRLIESRWNGFTLITNDSPARNVIVIEESRIRKDAFRSVRNSGVQVLEYSHTKDNKEYDSTHYSARMALNAFSEPYEAVFCRTHWKRLSFFSKIDRDVILVGYVWPDSLKAYAEVFGDYFDARMALVYQPSLLLESQASALGFFDIKGIPRLVIVRPTSWVSKIPDTLVDTTSIRNLLLQQGQEP